MVLKIILIILKYQKKWGTHDIIPGISLIDKTKIFDS